MTTQSVAQALHKQQLGKAGETIASEYLQKHGYRIIDRNFKARYGELDIVCIKDSTLVFVEVKTRMGDEFGLPEESVTPKKLKEIVQTGLYYSQLHPSLPDSVRIDVIGIELTSGFGIVYFNHIESVTS